MEKLQKTIIVLVIVLVLILVSTVSLYYYNKSKLTYTYQGKEGDYSFYITKKGGITTHVVRVFVDGNNEYYYPLRYGPREVASLDSEGNFKEALFSSEEQGKFKKILYITQDPLLGDKTESKSILAVFEINRITGNNEYGIFKIPTLSAVTSETERSKELEIPLITCDNVSSSVGVIWLKLGDSNGIYNENGCIILEGKTGDDLLMLSDKLVLSLLGVF